MAEEREGRVHSLEDLAADIGARKSIELDAKARGPKIDHDP